MKNLPILFSISLVLVSYFAQGQNHKVKLLTSNGEGQTMLMSPGYLKIAQGDTVTFIPSDTSHNVESISIPKNAEIFASEMGKEFSYTFNKNGVYLYKCTPHFALGMLGVIQVDEADNIKQVHKDWTQVNPGVVMNKARVIAYLAQVK